jgi:hypothetical protein
MCDAPPSASSQSPNPQSQDARASEGTRFDQFLDTFKIEMRDGDHFVVYRGCRRGGMGCRGEYSKHADYIIDRCRAGHAGGEVWFSPHPESMTLGELMTHIATTNYQCCAGLTDSEMPALPDTTDKDAIVKFLSDSARSSAGQVCPPRASSCASGNLLRVNGIKPPNYMV